MCKVSMQLKENCRESSRHKIASIYTQTDTWTDRQADSSIPPKTFFLRGYKNTHTHCREYNRCLTGNN